MTRILALFLLGVTLGVLSARELVAAAADRYEAEGPVEIDIPILAAGFGAQFFEETARSFEKLRPDVRVNIAGDARIHEKVRIRVMAGDFPDATDAVLLYETLIANGKLMDLAPLLEGKNWEGDAHWRETFLPGVLDRWTRGGHIYGIPFAYGVWTMFYDKALFAKHGWQVPKTWDEFFSLCQAMKAQGIPPIAFPGVYMRYGDAFLRAAHYNLAGAKGYREYNELVPGSRTTPEFVRAAEVTQKISTQYFLNGWEGMTHTAAQQAFLDRKAAMTISAWFVSEMRTMIPQDFELGAFNLPVFSDGVAEPEAIQAQAGYYFLFATGDARKEQATIDFFRYLTSRERAQAFARALEAPVALRAVEPSIYENSAMRDIAAMIRRAPATFDSAPPASAAFQALFFQAMTDARYGLMTGRITPQAFGEQLERAAVSEVARAGEQNRVDIKHPGKAALLLIVVGGGLLSLLTGRLWSRVRRGGGSEAEADSPGGRPHGRNEARLRNSTGAMFVGPALAVFSLFVLVPSGMAVVWAFSHWDGFTPRSWAGLFNFKWLLFESDAFWFALRNNLYVMFVPTLAVVPTALLLAALIHRGVWGANFFRAVFLFPNLLGGIAATLLWMNAYDPHGGLVNTALVKFGHLTGSAWLQSFAGYAWLSQGTLYHALIPIYLWMACGFNLVLYLAAMQGISPELYEAAELDGASPLRQFFSITLPQIWDVLTTSAVFTVIAGLNTFEMIWLLTSQDPVSRTHVLSTLMVSTMFREFQVGRATAIAVVMFLLVLIGSASIIRGMGKRDTVVE